MKKTIFPLLAIIIGIPLLISAIHINNYRKIINEMCPNIYISEFTCYEGRSIEEANSLLKNAYADSYAGYTYNTNVYKANVVAKNKTETTNVFLATKDIIENYRFWTLKKGEELTYSKVNKLIPVLLGGRKYNDVSVGSQITLTIFGEEDSTYTINALVVGKTGILKNIPEYEKMQYLDRKDYYTSFVIMPDIGDLVTLRGKDHIFLWNTKYGAMPPASKELLQIGYFNMFSNGFGSSIDFNNYFTISLILIPLIIIVVGMTLLIMQVLIILSKKRKINNIARISYEKI